MDKTAGLLLAVVCAVFLVGAVGLPNQVVTTPGVITVSGEAVVKVVPDEVLITLGVETFHRELSVAKRRNEHSMQDIISIAKRYGVAAKDIQTDYISIEPSYGDSYPYTTLDGYFVRCTIVVTLKDIGLFEDLFTAVTEAGATNVHGIDFRTSELRKYRDQARALAVQAASEKAEAMAGELSISVGKPKSITEDHAGWWSWYGYGWWGSRYTAMSQNVVQNAAGPSPDFEGAFAPGQISINARVTVTFELLN
jgi:uncharacterized protein YggE